MRQPEALVALQTAENLVIPRKSTMAMNVVCYGCRAPLAVLGWGPLGNLEPRGRATAMQIAMGLVRRPEKHSSGLPRYGPPRRDGHGDGRHEHVNNFARAWKYPASGDKAFDFYVNCHRCDRGQIVRSPDLVAAPADVLIFP